MPYPSFPVSDSEIEPSKVNWETALKNGEWMHWTGITPALSKGAYDLLKDGLKLAREKGMAVSADPTYRSGLWKYGQDPKEALIELLNYSTIFIGGVNEINENIVPYFQDQRKYYIHLYLV